MKLTEEQIKGLIEIFTKLREDETYSDYNKQFILRELRKLKLGLLLGEPE